MKRILLFITITISSLIYSQAPTNGLVAYYGFENNGNSHNGVHNLTNSHTTGTPITYSPSGNGTGNAATFNYTGLKNTSISPLINTEFTIAFWQKNTASQNETYASRFEMFGSAFYRNNSPGVESFTAISTTNGTWNGPAMGINLTNNTWQHIAIRFGNTSNGMSIEVFVNGILDATQSYNIVGATSIYKYNQVLAIGAGVDLTGTFAANKSFIGTIDEFYIYNRVLSAAEINNVKNNQSGIPVVTSPTITSVSHTATNNSATINYSLNANNSATTSIVKYGLTSTSLTSQVTGFSASGNSFTPGNSSINGLTASTTYYYQIEATNTNGTSTSTIGNFTTSATNSLTNGLLAYYSFENNNNSYDNIHNLTNSATPNPTYNTGKYGQGIDFGTGGGALTNTSMNTPFNTAEYSIAFWEKRSSNTIPYSTSFELFGSNFFRVFNTGINNGFKINSNVNWANEYVTYAATYYDTWTHYAFTWSITSDGLKHMSFYVNGSLVGISSIGYLSDALLEKFNSVIAIGNGTNANGTIHTQKAYTGLLDEFYIYNRAITASEVIAVMNNSAGVVLSNENFSNNLKATIQPNPTSDNFTIEMENEVKSVEIYSLQGQKVLTSSNKNISVSSLPKGTYLVQIKDENNNRNTQKLIVK